MHQKILYSELSPRELGERAVFRFLVKAAAVVLLSLLDWFILSIVPAGMPLPMKAVLYFMLAFTMVMLCTALLCDSADVRKYAARFFGLGVCVTILALVVGTFFAG